MQNMCVTLIFSGLVLLGCASTGTARHAAGQSIPPRELLATVDSPGRTRGNLPSEHGEREGGVRWSRSPVETGSPSADDQRAAGASGLAQQASPVGGKATTESGDPPKVGGRRWQPGNPPQVGGQPSPVARSAEGGSTRRREPEGTLAPLVEQLARGADGATQREERLRLATEAMRVGDVCVKRHPTMTACYYFRAMATGLHYQITILGYQKGIKQMIADCQKAIGLDPMIDHAGPFRMLGQIYTQLPKTTIHPGDVTRDLDVAQQYLAQAVARAPEFPENHLALCQALLEADAFAPARPVCDTAHQLAHAWPSATDREAWIASLAKLKKRLAKSNADR